MTWGKTMYDYSPISKLYIRNFRNLGDVEISFKESPIVTLVGENEAGKTSVIKAFATCALHASPRDQKDFIRDGTDMFGVSIELENGRRITRIKENNGINSYKITDSNNNLLWSTNKLSEGLPMEVQSLMGLIAEPETGEFLHIRTYEDKLLFVVTPNSTNYKVMYNALKVEQLTRAIKLGSSEVNSLRNEINSNDSSMQTLQYQLRNISVYDVEPLVNVRNRLTEQLGILDKLEKAKELLDRVSVSEEKLGALALIDMYNLTAINEVATAKLDRASRLLNNRSEKTNLLNKLSIIDSIEIIDTGLTDKIGNLISKINELNDKVSKANNLIQLSNLSEISEIVAMRLNKVMALYDKNVGLEAEALKIKTDNCSIIDDKDIKSINTLSKVISLHNKISENEVNLEQINDYIIKVQDYMKNCGVAVETCPNCGADVIIDIDKIGGA